MGSYKQLVRVAPVRDLRYADRSRGDYPDHALPCRRPGIV